MKLTIEITKKYFFTILAVLILMGGIFIYVYAYNSNNPQVMGHSADEIGSGIMHGPITIDSSNAQALSIKGGDEDHVYIAWYADKNAQNTRSAYMGFPGSGSDVLRIENELGNEVEINNNLKVNGNLTVGSSLAKEVFCPPRGTFVKIPYKPDADALAKYKICIKGINYVDLTNPKISTRQSEFFDILGKRFDNGQDDCRYFCYLLGYSFDNSYCSEFSADPCSWFAKASTWDIYTVNKSSTSDPNCKECKTCRCVV